MIKKVLLIGIVLGITVFLMIPSGAAPTDIVLDQQVELMVPGTFELIDADRDGKADEISFRLDIQAYREGDFVITGNLEGMRSGNWVSLGTTALPFQWSPDHKTVILTFPADNIVKYQISGPYRVTLGLKDGDFELPLQVVGFSAKYSYDRFQSGGINISGEISTISKAKRAAETWAAYQAVKLGKFLGANYNYDHWQVEYRDRYSSKIWRFVVSPDGNVEALKINSDNQS